MAEFFKKLISTLRMSDEEAIDEYESTQSMQPERQPSKPAYTPSEKPRKRPVAETAPVSRVSEVSSSYSEGTQAKRVHTASNYGSSTYIESRNNSKSLRMERPEGSKVVPIKTTRDGLEVCVMKPRNFEDSQDICDVLLSNCVAIINLEDNDIAVSQRIMDFMYGAVYSVNGKLFQIANLIFIAAPGAVDVSGDYEDILAQTGYDVPVLTKNAQ